MADKHTSETYCLSLKEKGKRHAQRKRLHVNRAFGSDCYYRIIDGDTDAGTTAGKAAGSRRWVYVEPEPMGPNICHVHTGQQRLLLQRTPSWFVIGDG